MKRWYNSLFRKTTDIVVCSEKKTKKKKKKRQSKFWLQWNRIVEYGARGKSAKSKWMYSVASQAFHVEIFLQNIINKVCVICRENWEKYKYSTGV